MRIVQDAFSPSQALTEHSLCGVSGAYYRTSAALRMHAIAPTHDNATNCGRSSSQNQLSRKEQHGL